MKERVRGRRGSGVLVLLVAAACAGGNSSGPRTPNGVLNPSLSEARLVPSGDFRVVFAAPRGEAPPGAEISVVFDRPLRALDRADAAPPALVVRPAIEGTVRWVGARALSFIPARGALPPATEISVQVPDGVRALDGSRLKGGFQFTFTTPRPRLTATIPSDGESGVLPDAALGLTFNQRVAKDAITRWGRLEAAGRALPFAVEAAPEDEPNSVVVRPRKPLPLDQEIKFSLASELVGEEGPLPAGSVNAFTFRTLGPMRVNGVECNHDSPEEPCKPGYGVGLSFSNPARLSDLVRAVTLTPSSPWPRAAFSDDSSTSYLELPGRLAPGQTYALRVAAGLRDIYGQRLAREFSTKLAMDDVSPRVVLGVSDGSLVLAERGPIPIVAVNAPGASVSYAALNEADLQGLSAGPEAFEALVKGHPGVRRLMLPAGTKNQLVRSQLDLEAALGGTLAVVGMSAQVPQAERDSDAPLRSRLLKLADLAVSAKLSRQGSALWVTRLSSAAPVPNAEVKLIVPGGATRRYVTDGNGFAAIPASDFAPSLDEDSHTRDALLVVKSGEEWTFERVGDVIEPWQLPVATNFGAELELDGLLFSDRDVYRPGDTVRLKGIVRRQTARGSSIPSGEAVTVKLSSPEGEELRKKELRVSRFGTFACDLKLPQAAGLGSYELSAALGKQRIEHHVSIEEYRPAEFKVAVTAPTSAVRGDTVETVVHGEYLYGADMAGAALSTRFSRSPASFWPPGSEGFVTSAASYFVDLESASLEGGSIGNADAHLDEHGQARAPLKLALPNQRGAERVLIDAEVTDVGRQSGAGSSAILVHPGEFYLGLADPSELFVTAPARVPAKLVAFSPDGARLAGKRVHVDLIARRWSHQRVDGGPFAQTVSKVVDTVVGACDVVTQQSPVSCSLNVAKAGYYLLHARASDARHNSIESAVGFYALGPGQSGWRSDDGNGVELVLDKPSYAVGETAKVLIKSPFPEAEALVTVERANVLRSERHKLVGATPVLSIPVTEEFRPNAFVSVLLFRPLGKDAAAHPGAAYRIGYANVVVESESRRLDVAVTPSAKQLEPGATLSVDVRVNDRAGRPVSSEVALYAVDEGVLSLTGYRVPDPLSALSQPRPLGVATLESRTQLAKIQAPGFWELLGMGKGADGGGGGGDARQDFRATAYFNPTLFTDANGRVSERFRLPDSLSSYRVMAVVVGDGERYGFGSAVVTTSRKLMLRPALPRFLRSGDRLDAALIVASKDADLGDVRVSAALKGVRLLGPATKTVRVARGGQVEVRFPISAEAAGTAELRFSAEGGGARDAVALKLPIESPTELEAVAVTGQTQSRSTEAIGALAGIRSDVGQLSLSVASSALVGLDNGLRALSEYPYGCTEQLASRLLPFGALATLSHDFGLPASALAPATAGQLIRAIVARQHGDGGFSLWPESGKSEPWVSAYALWSLHEARRRGFEVPESVIVAGRRYLRAQLAKLEHDPLTLASLAYAVDVLSDLSDADRGYMTRLFAMREQLPLFARALLLHAMAVNKVAGGPVETLLAELEATIRVTDGAARVVVEADPRFSPLFDSETRTQAFVLRALVAARKNHPLAAPLARGLLAARRGGTWRTTQETAFALLALDAYRSAEEAAEPNFVARVLLGERELMKQPFRGRSLRAAAVRVDMSQLAAAKGAPLGFQVDGEGSLFYEARLEYARAEPPRTPLDAGFFVERAFKAADEGAADPAPGLVAAGAVLRGEITVVSSEPRDFVVIDAPLPAGLEAINTSLLTTSRRYADAEEAQARAAPLTHRELHDDRVLFFVDHLPPGIYHYGYLARATSVGHFVVPSTRAFAMYTPEAFGRTAATALEVK